MDNYSVILHNPWWQGNKVVIVYAPSKASAKRQVLAAYNNGATVAKVTKLEE